MRRITGYLDGHAIWSENVPSSSLSFRLNGSLVVGDPGAVARHRKKAHARQSIAEITARIAAGAEPPARHHNTLYLTDEARLEARRRSYRESKERARQRRERAA